MKFSVGDKKIQNETWIKPLSFIDKIPTAVIAWNIFHICFVAEYCEMFCDRTCDRSLEHGSTIHQTI